MNQPEHHSVLVLDDHRMIINGIRSTIAHLFQHFYEASEGATALDLAIKYQPSLIIMDVQLPDGEGHYFARELRAGSPGSRILAYTFNFEETAIHNMYSAGVNGYVLKKDDESEFLLAIEYLLSGREYFCVEARDLLINRISALHVQPRRTVANIEFTKKEIEIIRLICYQHTAREISEQVSLSERTVEQYRSNISKRIGAKNLVGVIRFALKNGIIRLEEL